MLEISEQITFCYTSRFAETTEFYEGLLGLVLLEDQGCCRIYQVTSSAYLGVCERQEAARPEGIILTLVTERVDESYEALLAKGVEFEAPPKRNETFGIYHCFFRDPNGYLLEIQRFENPNWRYPKA